MHTLHDLLAIPSRKSYSFLDSIAAGFPLWHSIGSISASIFEKIYYY